MIQDIHSKRQVNLTRDWDYCFLPGQKVGMSMVFRKPLSRLESCPSCTTPCTAPLDEDIECISCGMIFGKMIVLEDHFEEPLILNTNVHTSRRIEPQSAPASMAPKKRKRMEEDEDDEVKLFRRVRVIGSLQIDSGRCKVWNIVNDILYDCGIGFCATEEYGVCFRATALCNSATATYSFRRFPYY